MLEYLILLPCEVLGYNMLGYLELIDIIQLERAASSHKWQSLLRAILHYCPAVILSYMFQWKHESIHWFNKRQFRVYGVKLGVKLLCVLDFEHSILDNIEFYIEQDTSLDYIKPLKNTFFSQNFAHLKIKGNQDPAVMEVLFSLLSNNSSVRSLYIESSNLTQWMEHIKKIGPYLRELGLFGRSTQLSMITTITKLCPYLKKLSLNYMSDMSDNNILQSIANNCPRLRSLDIENLDYNTSVEADADLTAFAEKCLQLEELRLYCQQVTDQSVIALAQHCSRLKKLKLRNFKLTAASLIVLSERGLPLEELVIPWIPIPCAEIATQCAHALSRFVFLNMNPSCQTVNDCCALLQYMTGLRELNLWGLEDHLLVPHLLLLLQGQRCAGLESLMIGSDSSITPQQFSELVAMCPQLHTLHIHKSTCSFDAVLVELARSCPHLQEVTLDCSSEVTEEGVLALAVHCRQLRVIIISETRVSEETVRQLAQHCRRLTKLHVECDLLTHGKCDISQYTRKDLMAMREKTV